MRSLALAPPSSMTWRSHMRAVLDSPALLVWCLFLLLGPLYVFGSGLPQPGDWLLLVLAPLSLFSWDGRLERSHSRVIKALLLFTLWTAVVNWGWATALWKWGNKFDYVLHPLFYVFNAAVVLCGLVLARQNPERFLRITIDIVFVTIIACAVMSTVVAPSGGRTTVFFNSPNQMGYYALLSACLFAMSQRPLRIRRLRAGLGVAACAYLGLLSASRASLAGIVLLLVVLVFSNPKLIIVGVIAAAGIGFVGGPVDDAVEFNQKRALEDRDPSQSFAKERGYDRIWRYPEHLVLGAGEGDNKRFAEEGYQPRELHSSFGSLLFCYGAVGMSLFLLFCWRAVRGASLRGLMMLVPALVYTVAHQGLRFTMFWVVIVAFVVLKSFSEKPGGPVTAHS